MSNLVPESRVKHPIVERFLICKSVDGRSTAIRLQIGLPLPIDNDPGRWQSEVCLAGLYDAVVFAPGVDSFQCMLLAIELIKKALESAEQSGAQFFWRDGSGPVQVKGLFS